MHGDKIRHSRQNTQKQSFQQNTNQHIAYMKQRFAYMKHQSESFDLYLNHEIK